MILTQSGDGSPGPAGNQQQSDQQRHPVAIWCQMDVIYVSARIEISESDIENAYDGPRRLGIYELTALSPSVRRPTRW